jgi:hypothetical protein
MSARRKQAMTTPLGKYDMDEVGVPYPMVDGEWMKADEVEAVLKWACQTIIDAQPQDEYHYLTTGDKEEAERILALLTAPPAERGD